MISRDFRHINRRRLPRMEMRLGAGLSLVSRLIGRFAGKPEFQCATRDVSVDGMRLVSDRQIPERTAVKLWVTMPDDEGKTLELDGWVRWTSNDGTTGKFLSGIRLDTFPSSSMAGWARAIRERIREHFINPIQQANTVTP